MEFLIFCKVLRSLTCSLQRSLLIQTEPNWSEIELNKIIFDLYLLLCSVLKKQRDLKPLINWYMYTEITNHGNTSDFWLMNSKESILCPIWNHKINSHLNGIKMAFQSVQKFLNSFLSFTGYLFTFLVMSVKLKLNRE